VDCEVPIRTLPSRTESSTQQMSHQLAIIDPPGQTVLQRAHTHLAVTPELITEGTNSNQNAQGQKDLPEGLGLGGGPQQDLGLGPDQAPH
jgi:hypothetical protein